MKALFVIVPLLFSSAAFAQGEHSGRNGDWYKSLKMPGTQTSCCDISDCHPVEARTNGDHYEVLIEEKWRTVPSEKVLQRTTNPTGSAVACYHYYKVSDTVNFYCFVAGDEI